MKRIAILATIVAAGLTTAGISAGLSAQGLPGVGATDRVSENVYKIFGAGGNTTFFIRSDGVVLVDTKLPNNGAAILAKVREVTDKPVTMIINTHSHPDHLGSNTEIDSARGGVEVVVHANTARRMAGTPTNNKVTQSFDDRLTLGQGRDQIDLFWFGPAHTDGDAFIVFPGEKVMLTGDVMAWDMGLLVDPGSGGSMLGTAETVKKAAATLTGIETVVEGHGDINNWTGFLRYAAFTQKIVEVARRGVSENLDYVQAYDRYFATDPAMAPYTSEQIKPGLEYGGTPKSRSHNNIYVAMAELRGEQVPLIMGAPPPPGSPPAAPGGPGGPGAQGAGRAPVSSTAPRPVGERGAP
jgi:glyoxylase-like metal-dependent hydrolase (beta-lactamase superfamily II)